jgi:tetratricopeptide repeat protein 8
MLSSVNIFIFILIFYANLPFFFSLDMFRDSEKQYLLSLEIQPMVDTYLYLAKIYLRLDQPLLSISKLQEGLEKFPYEPCLVQAIARIHEVRLKI